MARLSYPVGMIRIVNASLVTTFIVFASAGFAVADKIDGSWCAPTGESMTIEGPRVITPGGRTLSGRYDRHNFSYDIPDGEKSAGGRMDANQLDDEHIRVTIAPPAQTEPAPHAIWTRCEVIS